MARGVVFSALAHLPIALWLLTVPPKEPPGSATGEGRPVAVTLAMFTADNADTAPPDTGSDSGEDTAKASPVPEPEPNVKPEQELESSAVAAVPNLVPFPAAPPVSVKPESKPAQRKSPAPSQQAPKKARVAKKNSTPSVSKARKPRPAKPTPKHKTRKPARPKGSGKGKAAQQRSTGKSGASKAASGSSGTGNSARRGSSGDKRKVKAAEGAYLQQLQRAIARKRFYPRAARRKGITGIVTVSFVLKADGRITNVRIAKGSGHTTLDKAAIKTLVRLGRYKPIPTQIGRSRWSLRVPINFDLK